jgi:hypothetical protein
MRSMSEQGRAQITFGPRGEGVVYYRDRRTLHVEYTYGHGPKLHPDLDLHRWPNGEPLSEREKRIVFLDIVRFVRGGLLARLFGRPLTVVVNDDDPDRALWTRLAGEAGVRVEHSSDEAQLCVDRQRYLNHILAQRVLRINGAELRTEAELDAFLVPRHQAHRDMLRRQRFG